MRRSDFPWRVLLYGLYAMLLVAVLLYVRFPEERFRAYCENRLQRTFPAWKVRIEAIGYQLPATLIFKQVGLSETFDRQPSQVLIDRVAVTINPFRPLAMTLAADLYSGQLQAALTVNRQQNDFRLEAIELTGMDLTAVAAGLGMTEREVAGRYNFFGIYQAAWAAPLDGQGEGRVEITAGKMGLLAPVLLLSSINFNILSSEITFHGGEVQLVGAELRGNELSADFSGTVRLASPLPESELLLNGLLRPDETYLQANPREQMLVQRLQQRYNTAGLPFRVGGTFSGPTFRFGGE